MVHLSLHRHHGNQWRLCSLDDRRNQSDIKCVRCKTWLDCGSGEIKPNNHKLLLPNRQNIGRLLRWKNHPRRPKEGVLDLQHLGNHFADPATSFAHVHFISGQVFARLLCHRCTHGLNQNDQWDSARVSTWNMWACRSSYDLIGLYLCSWFWARSSRSWL